MRAAGWRWAGVGTAVALTCIAVWAVKRRAAGESHGASLSRAGVEAGASRGEGDALLPAPGGAVRFDALALAARRDLAGFAAWLGKHLALLTPEQRTAFLREWMRRWTAEWNGGESELARAFHRLAADSPAIAGQLVALLPSVPLRHVLVQDLVRSWGASDPTAAERWIATLREADDRSHALTALAEARLSRDPAAAMQWATARLQGTDQPAIVQDLTAGFAASDPRLAAAWTATLDAGAVKDKATVTLATVWADRDATKAGEWAAGLAPGAARDDAVTVVGQVWAGAAPEEAIRWFAAQNFTSPEARALAFRDFSEALTIAEPEASERWIASLTDPAAADAALAGAAEATYDESPERAALTALKIQDLVSRTTAVGDVMKAWREDDPDAAEKFAAEHLVKPKSKAAK